MEKYINCPICNDELIITQIDIPASNGLRMDRMSDTVMLRIKEQMQYEVTLTCKSCNTVVTTKSIKNIDIARVNERLMYRS